MKLSLARKLSLGFGTILALMVFTASMSYLKTSAMMHAEDRMVNVRVPSIEAAQSLQRDLNQTQSKGRQAILAGGEPAKRDAAKVLFDDAWGGAGDDVAALDELAPKWEQVNRDLLADAKQQLPMLRAAQEAAMTLAAGGEHDAVVKAGNEFAEKATPSTEAVKKSLGALEGSFVHLVDENKEELNAANHSLNLTMAVSTFAALVIGISLAFFLIRGITAADTREKMASAESASQLAAIDRSQAVIEFKMDGTLVTANDIFLKATGYTLDEVKGKHHRMFVDEVYQQSADYGEFWAKLNRGEYQAGEYRQIGKGGRSLDSGLLQPDPRPQWQTVQSRQLRYGRHPTKAGGRGSETEGGQHVGSGVRGRRRRPDPPDHGGWHGRHRTNGRRIGYVLQRSASKHRQHRRERCKPVGRLGRADHGKPADER